MKYDTIIFKCFNGGTGMFMPELQKGFYVISHEGATIYSFLTEECRISDEYISEKVQTVFIDGGPVDDIYNTKIKEGGVCALSGAMPGIVGAMMRIGSPYAAMRDSITVKPDQSLESGKEIIIVLKLFNVIFSDNGTDFLKRGILLDKKRLSDFLVKHGDELLSHCNEIRLNRSLVEKNNLIKNINGSITDPVMLKIEITDESKS